MTDNSTKHRTHLVLGGARSGKTAYAMSVADKLGLEKWMIVTCKAEDQEMIDRIALHKSHRGLEWVIIEEDLEIIEKISCIVRSDRILVLDCLTIWLSNIIFSGIDPLSESRKLGSIISASVGPIILVGNEIGLGLVPDTKLGRAFRDAHGQLNQIIAAACDEVTFVMAGLPLALKSPIGDP